MSSLLEQSIADAKVLKDAALKNAENVVLEKYADEIKDAVKDLLEASEEEDLLLDDEEAGAEEEVELPEIGEPEEEESPLVAALDDAPAHLEGEEGLGTDKPVDIVIDLAAIAKGAREEAKQELELPVRDELAAPPAGEEAMPEELPMAVGESSESDEDLDELFELNFSEEEAVSNDVQEELEELKHDVKDLLKVNESYKKLVVDLKKQLVEISTTAAKQLYTNRVLRDDSLNERQKESIVESISKTQTVEEAKAVFEALQKSMESFSKKEDSKSLTEAVERRSSSALFAKEKQQVADPSVSRMQRLAGITLK
jgi:hypothetical protein